MIELFNTTDTAHKSVKTSTSLTKQIEKIRKGMIQKTLIISHSTTSADRGRILMIQELQKQL